MKSLYKIVTSAIASLVLSLSSCKAEYADPEIPLAAETDGNLDDRVVDWFLDTRFVDAYGPEPADLINEVVRHEIGKSIDSRIGVRFVDYFYDGSDYEDIDAKSIYNGKKYSGIKVIKFKELIYRNDMSPTKFVVDTYHELGHQIGNCEIFGILFSARLGVKTPMIFPDFGENTKYSTFIYALDQLARARDAILRNDEGFRNEEYGIGALACMLALNEQDGSFRRVTDILSEHENAYITKAHLIMDYCESQPKVEDVKLYPYDVDNSDLSVVTSDVSYFRMFVAYLFNANAILIVRNGLREEGRLSIGEQDKYLSLVRHMPYEKEGFSDPYIRTYGFDIGRVAKGISKE